MRVLVTGADGIVGQHICAHLREHGQEVIEGVGPAAESVNTRLKLDVTDAASVFAAFRASQPDAVINLAGYSSVAKADTEPDRAWRINALGSVNVLTAARDLAPKARILLVGSGETYGLLPPKIRADEKMPLQPRGVYASSKAAAELAGLQFWRGAGLQVVLARPFNHLGRGQRHSYVVPSFAIQIHAIRRGMVEPTIRVGNLEAIRDFLHVEDTVAAYRLLLTRGEPGAAYNVCSGIGRSIRSLLDEMLNIAGVRARVEVDPVRFRPGEIPELVGNNELLKQLGWSVQNSVAQGLREVMEEHHSSAAP